MIDGYYNRLNEDAQRFIALREGGEWFLPGIEHAVEIPENLVVGRVPDLEILVG